MAAKRYGKRADRVAKRVHAKKMKALDEVRRGAYDPPSQEDCEPFEYMQHVDDEATLILWDRTYRIDGILRRFSIELYAERFGDEPELIERYCCSHGIFHVHRGDSKKLIGAIEDVSDLQLAYQHASAMAMMTARSLLQMEEKP